MEQVLAHDNSFLKQGIVSAMTIRDCVITETAAQDDSGLFSDGETAERCVVYGNRSGQAGGSSPVGFWDVRKVLDSVAANRTSSDMLSGDGFNNCDTLGCVAYAHAGDGFQGSVFQYSVAFTNVKVGFYLGANVSAQNCLAVANESGFVDQNLVSSLRVVDNHAARNPAVGFWLQRPGVIAVDNSAQGNFTIGGSAKGGAGIVLTGGTTINTNNAWANFSW